MKRSREPEEHLDRGGPADLRDHDDDDNNYDYYSSHAESRHVKTPALDNEDEDEHGEASGAGFAMRCSLPPHKEALGFRSYGDYEAHYQKSHTNRCLECRKNFPTEHLLGIHIEECHDPLARVARERGEHTYSCFVEGCGRKCMTPQKRRLHLIDKHAYPKNFFFAVTRQGVDGRRSLLNEGGQRRRSSSGMEQQQQQQQQQQQEKQQQQHHPKEGRQRRQRGSEQETQPPATREQEERGQPVPSTGAAGAPDEEPKTEKEPQDVEMAELTGAMSALQFVPPSIRFGRGRAGFSRKR